MFTTDRNISHMAHTRGGGGGAGGGSLVGNDTEDRGEVRNKVNITRDLIS